ncbi:hypothetical protein TeGR_g11537 [Tetraparma gracilis]|jgi:hypothetical protein|uniref:Uncharacterized protein n=1 Tax=Tetraparma gracilis TaxID=2962635 RepID=A0ABQ6MX50_9STRA|nr:hypothetical protein TeGR_g11537 [Tetraparma gracilis]
MSATTRENFSPADTFGRPLDPDFAHASLSERDYRIAAPPAAPLHTFADWKKASLKLEPALDHEALATLTSAHETSKSIYEQMERLGPQSARQSAQERTLREDPRTSFNPALTSTVELQSKQRPRPIHGYTGYFSRAALPPDMRDATDSTERSLMQDMSVNCGGSVKIGFTFDSYAPGMGATTSGRTQMEAVAHKRRFQCTERSFRRSESNFIKHGALAKKFARQNVVNEQAMGRGRTGSTTDGRHGLRHQEPWHHF